MNVGIDFIENERLQNIATDEVKLGSLFTEKEIEYFKKFKFNLEHVAGGFVAKEAVAKALKTGFNATIMPLKVEILHYPNGAPYVNLKGEARTYFESQSFTKIDISISHTKKNATAICIIE